MPSKPNQNSNSLPNPNNNNHNPAHKSGSGQMASSLSPTLPGPGSSGAAGRGSAPVTPAPPGNGQIGSPYNSNPKRPGTNHSSLTRRLQLNTWRGQASLLALILAVLTLVALLITITNTNNRIERFQQLATVAVPAIDATNDATQLLSSEVAGTADYILADQLPAASASASPNGAAAITSTNTSSAAASTASNTVVGVAAYRQNLLKQIEKQRAQFELTLQTNYKALVNYSDLITPKAEDSLNYLSTYNARLHDALAQARGLVDNNNLSGATQAYLNGQNAYYQSVISSLYYFRSVHIFQLEDAASEATNAAALQQYLAAGSTILFAVLLLAINLWLTFKVKRVLIPLVNIALIGAALYSFYLWTVFNGTAVDLKQMQVSYTNATTVTDAQLYVTNAAADQVQAVIGGHAVTATDPNNTSSNPIRFQTDPVYDQDFSTELEQLLALKDNATGVNQTQTNPQLLTDCPPSEGARAAYKFSGTLAGLCRRLSRSDSEGLASLNQFIASYRNWVSANNSFHEVVTAGRVGEGLSQRAGNATNSFNQMSTSLAKLKQLSLDTYRSSSSQGTNSLNVAIWLAWVVYLGGLGLAEIGLLRWRQEF